MKEFNQSKDTDIYLDLFILLYADDTVVLTESKEDFQTAMNDMNDYCEDYKLNINTSKTKVMVFSRGKI